MHVLIAQTAAAAGADELRVLRSADGRLRQDVTTSNARTEAQRLACQLKPRTTSQSTNESTSEHRVPSALLDLKNILCLCPPPPFSHLLAPACHHGAQSLSIITLFGYRPLGRRTTRSCFVR